MVSTDLMSKISGRPSPLVSADELQTLLGAPGLKLFDVRGTWKTPARPLPEDYAKGHIPGAVFLDWTRHFMEADVPPGLASISNTDGAHRAFQELGINAGDLVVLYDDYSHMQAGRIWLAMRHFGFESVRVLDGGWGHWKKKGFSISTDTAQPTEGSFEPKLQTGWKIDIDDFLCAQSNSCVIDARGPISYAGDPDDPRTGHIPGALSAPFSALLDADTGLFLGKGTLEHVLDTRAPGWRYAPVIASCGSGYAATVLLLALKEIGRNGVLFDGSFAVWKQDPTRPVEQSPRA